MDDVILIAIGAIFGILFTISLSEYFFKTQTHMTPKEARAMVVVCEKELPRNQVCKLVAIPETK